MSVKQYHEQYPVGGIDFRATHYASAGNPLPFIPGTRGKDQQGQKYIYAKFTAQLASTDIDEGSFPVVLLATRPNPVGDTDVTAAHINDGLDGSDLNGLYTELIGKIADGADFVDGVLERRVAGATANQFVTTPTVANPAGTWVKTSGVAVKLAMPAGVAAGDVIIRKLAAGAFLERTATQTATEIVFGVALNAVAGGVADVVFDCPHPLGLEA